MLKSFILELMAGNLGSWPIRLSLMLSFTSMTRLSCVCPILAGVLNGTDSGHPSMTNVFPNCL